MILAPRLWLLGGVLVAFALLAGLVAYYRHDAHQAHAEATAARGREVVAQGEAKAADKALGIVQAGQARDITIINREGEHRATILSAPGAGAAADPGLLDALHRGMCGYPVTTDPRCAGLRPADPAIVSGAGEGGEPAGADGR